MSAQHIGLLRFPLKLVGGTLQAATDLVDYTEGRILQQLMITKRELVADPNYGAEYRLFTASTDTKADCVQLQLQLTAEIPEATFNVTGETDDNGKSQIVIRWSYQGVSRTITYQSMGV